MKKILVLYTSVGLGHKTIADNLSFHLTKAGYEVFLHDILKVEKGFIVDAGIWLHSFINRRLPFLWRWLYFSKLVTSIGLLLRVPLAKTHSDKLHNLINQFQPDAILATQTTASSAVAGLIDQKKFTGKFIIAFSDYHLHRLWLYDQADLYLANTTEQKNEMISLGVDEKKIAVCGITLKPVSAVDEEELRSQYKIPSDDKLVIFASGSLGIGFSAKLLEEYLKQLITTPKNNISVIVFCGKNQALKSGLDALALPKVFAQNFVADANKLYAIADVLVTKPGGLTVAEALQSKIKILITHTLPGQEEPNYDYLLSRRLVRPYPEPMTAQNLAKQTIQTMIEDKDLYEENTSWQEITQFGQEGQVVVRAIEDLFHRS